LAQENGFFSCILAQFAEAGKNHSKVVHLLEKSVINMISLLLPVFDWSRWFAISSLHLFPVTEKESHGWCSKKVNN
jgi:hypothetical protein